MRELTGAILIGGLSRRMGRDKATLQLPDGRRMMDVVAAALRVVCDDVVFVGTNPGQVKAEDCIIDLRANAGPLGGIEALLASKRSGEFLVCPCDLPMITPEVLRHLLQNRECPATVLRLAGREDFEPLPARIALGALPTVQRLLDGGQRSVWKLMQSLPAAIVEVDSRHAAALRNINTPDDLSTV